METENKDWKPEVGKTAWYNYHDGSKGNEIREVIVDREENVLGSTSFSVYSKKYGMSWDYVGLGEIFPTPEAALASIKIYDLEGKEVVIPRAQDKIIIEMCDRAAEQIANLSEWDDADYAQLGMAPIINAFKEIIAVRDRAAIKMVAKLVYEMNLPENPEGEARLKAAQERFKSAIGGKSDQKESK